MGSRYVRLGVGIQAQGVDIVVQGVGCRAKGVDHRA